MNEVMLASIKENTEKISEEVAQGLEGMSDSQALTYLLVLLVGYSKLSDQIGEKMIDSGQYEAAQATLMQTQGLNARIQPFVKRVVGK